MKQNYVIQCEVCKELTTVPISLIKKVKEKEKERIYYGIISIFEEFKEESPTYCIGLFMNVVLKELKLKKGE